MQKAKKLEIVYLPISKLIHLEGNPRRVVDSDARKNLKKLITTHGFQNPLQVFREKNGKYSIICGNHRFDAGKELKMKEFPCLIYVGSKKKAISRAISDNKSNEWTDWDAPLLRDAFADLDDGAFDITWTGFNGGEVKSFFENTPTGDPGNLSDKFITPPFSVLNSRGGEWQSRKRFWRSLGIKSELGREGCAPGGSAKPAVSMKRVGGKFVRGDALGREVIKLKLMKKPKIEEFEGIKIIRDDYLPGGTKRRFLEPFLAQSDMKEFVYASPAYGYAQIALAYAAKATGKKATVFVAKRKQLHNRTKEAREAGAEIIEINHGYLSNIQSKAKKYAEEKGAYLLPFGADHPMAIDIIKRTAQSLKIKPKEVWVIAGSGTLSRGLQAAWPKAKFNVVVVGSEPRLGDVIRWDAPEKFEQPSKIQPPFPSCDNYDAKAWQFIKQHASKGALFWNVAK